MFKLYVMFRTTGLILLAAVKSPLLVVQIIHTRRTTPRLPDAAGKNQGKQTSRKGSTGKKGPALRLVVIGESTVAGVGTDKLNQAIGGSTAAGLSQITGKPVAWWSMGVTGIDIKGILADVLPEIQAGYKAFKSADKGKKTTVFLVCLGVNDTTGLTSIRRWQWRVAELVLALGRLDSEAKIIFAGVPPMAEFSALPQPLRFMLGQRAKQLQKALLEHPFAGSHFTVMPPLMLGDGANLAEDGYHPSSKGYADWGRTNAEFITDLLA